jgi:hypothetical protein
VPVAIGGGFLAGLEHDTARSGAIRGFVGGALFGGFILIVHELSGLEAKAHLPEPAIVLAVITSVIGGVLGALGVRWRAKREPREPAMAAGEAGSKAAGGPPPGSSD